MALKSTIFKAELQVSDLDRGHFATHALTLARHPSETDERMMVRLLAFALDADEEREIRKAAGRASQVKVYAYGRGAAVWWRENGEALSKLRNVEVLNVVQSG